MTIAACYVSHEGVVLGADSTSTYLMPDGSTRHHNQAQKILEVGETGSTLGIVTFGRMGLPAKSYRQLTAELSDGFLESQPSSVQEAAERFVAMMLPQYESQLKAPIERYLALGGMKSRSEDEDKEYRRLFNVVGMGVCIGGHVSSNRTPAAYEVIFLPGNKPTPVAVAQNSPRFWGMPNMMERLLNGIDSLVYDSIRTSPHWRGSVADLDALIEHHTLDARVQLPLREAIDWISSAIFITIKAMKFHKDSPYCGGPIELAAITADRRFRWIRHKGLDQALSEHIAYGGH